MGTVFGLFALVLGLVFVVLAPVFSIAALNVLFGLALPLTFKTWLAALWLNVIVGGGLKASFSKKD